MTSNGPGSRCFSLELSLDGSNAELCLDGSNAIWRSSVRCILLMIFKSIIFLSVEICMALCVRYMIDVGIDCFTRKYYDTSDENNPSY